MTARFSIGSFIGWCFLTALLVGFVALVFFQDTRKYYVSCPPRETALLAPDLATLAAILSCPAAQPAAAVPIPDGTKGHWLSSRYFKAGKLVKPYPSTVGELKKDRVVEVVLFEITEGPKRGLRGWLPVRFLRPAFYYL